ncbi:MAG: hypothetical protein H6839_10355 [Planctomycetes bacterium]|nr:hypothetical protein [Planctomycetota bacterium]
MGKFAPFLICSLLVASACADARIHRLASAQSTDVLHLAASAASVLPVGYSFDEHLRLRWGELVVIRREGVPVESSYSLVFASGAAKATPNPSYLPAGLQLSRYADSEVVTGGIIRAEDCAPHLIPTVSYDVVCGANDPEPSFADLRLRIAASPPDEGSCLVSSLAHARPFDDGTHSAAVRRALGWLLSLDDVGLCGLALASEGEVRAYEIFESTAMFIAASAAILHGFLATEVFGDLAPEAAEYTSSRLENVSLWGYWEGVALEDVISAANSSWMIPLSLSDEVDPYVETPYPERAGSRADVLQFIAVQTDAAWVLNGGTLLLVSRKTADQIEANRPQSGPRQSLFTQDRAMGGDPARLLAGLMPFESEQQRDMDKAEELTDQLVSLLSALLDEGTDLAKAGNAEEAFNHGNACLLALERVDPFLMDRQQLELYALRAQILLHKARKAAGISRPNWCTLNKTVELNGNKVHCTIDAKTHTTLQYSYYGE